MLEIFADAVSELKSDLNNLPHGSSLNLQTILNWVYSIMGVAAVAFLIRGGIMYMMSQGDPGKVKQGGQAIAWSVIGLAIILLAAAITTFIFGVVQEGVDNA